MDKMKKETIFIFAFIILLNTISAFGTSPASISINESINHIFNVSVNNPDAEALTQINITFPALFQINLGDEGTDATYDTFANTSNIFTWTGAALVPTDETKNFWFNASVPIPEDYTLTITGLNSSGSFSSEISVKVNDTTSPGIEFISPTPSNAATTNNSSILVNVSVSDNAGIGTITIFIYNENSLINSASQSGVSFFSANFGGLTTGTYYINATVNDTSGFKNSTETRTISLNFTSNICIPNWDSGDWGSCIDGTQIRAVTDLNNCNDDSNKPAENRTCTETCTPQWEIKDWETCKEDGTQTRNVTDSNNCGTTTGKPSTERSCEYKPELGGKFWIFIILMLVISIVISGVAYLLIHLISQNTLSQAA